MKILFFAPHAGIWSHAFPEALIGQALQNNNHEIVYVTCEQSFKNFCTVMAAFGYTNDTDKLQKQKACEQCQAYSKLIVSEFNFTHKAIKDYLDADDYRTCDNALSSITQDNLIDFKIDDIEIGRLTLYQILLEYKKNTLQFSTVEWQRVQIDLYNALISFYATRKMLAQEQPEAVMVYNSLYSVNHIFSKLAEKNNIKQYFLHAGGNLATRLETMILGESDGFKYYHHLLKKWHDFKHVPCTEKLIQKVSAHLLSVIQGSSIFSYSQGVSTAQVDIRAYFNIAPTQKLILATMSSNDERYAAGIVKAYKQSNEVLFADQISWLTEVIEYVKQRSDLFLLIRVHPREVPNRRESITSENYSKIVNLFKELPSNVKINWPEDNISLYHLAQETDLCLNSWSSAGKELSALGVPVLLYSAEIQVYPPDINYVGETREAYFGLWDKILSQGWDFERIRKVFRWYAFEYFRTTLDLSDSFKITTSGKVNTYYKKIMRFMDSTFIQKQDCHKRKLHLKVEPIINDIIENRHSSILDILENLEIETISLEEETHHLKNYIGKIFSVLMKNNTKETPVVRHFKKFMEAQEKHYVEG
ncbi:MAG: hypothetical protein JSR17_06005 [Proteobacteria bacterium]|nr:hypothetical protein [Pseudomonadota bacterium]